MLKLLFNPKLEKDPDFARVGVISFSLSSSEDNPNVIFMLLAQVLYDTTF